MRFFPSFLVSRRNTLVQFTRARFQSAPCKPRKGHQNATKNKEKVGGRECCTAKTQNEKNHRAAQNKESEDPDSRKSSVDASFKASQAAIHLLLHGIEVHQRGKEHHVLAVHGGQRQTELLHVFRKLLA